MRPNLGGEFAMGAGRRNVGASHAKPALEHAKEIARLHRLIGDLQGFGDRATVRIAELEAEVAHLRRELTERDVRDATGRDEWRCQAQAGGAGATVSRAEKQATHGV